MTIGYALHVLITGFAKFVVLIELFKIKLKFTVRFLKNKSDN